MGRKRDMRSTAIQMWQQTTSEGEAKRCGRVRFGQRARGEQEAISSSPAWRWAALIGPWPGLQRSVPTRVLLLAWRAPHGLAMEGGGPWLSV